MKFEKEKEKKKKVKTFYLWKSQWDTRHLYDNQFQM